MMRSYERRLSRIEIDDTPEYSVPGCVALRVVDRLQAVDIDEDHGKRLIGSVRSRDFAFQLQHT